MEENCASIAKWCIPSARVPEDMQVRLLVLALCVLSLSVSLLAQSKPTEDDLKLAQLANATRARELYLAGEAASKKGDLQTAIRDWAEALKLKRDSAYTAKCLADARGKLYKQY